MEDSVEASLESAFEEIVPDDLGFIIIEKAGEESRFFQFAFSPGSWTLDFPVISSNGNTVGEAENIEEVVSDLADTVGYGPAGGNGLKVVLGDDVDALELSKEIASEIRGDSPEIEIELQID